MTTATPGLRPRLRLLRLLALDLQLALLLGGALIFECAHLLLLLLVLLQLLNALPLHFALGLHLALLRGLLAKRVTFGVLVLALTNRTFLLAPLAATLLDRVGALLPLTLLFLRIGSGLLSPGARCGELGIVASHFLFESTPARDGSLVGIGPILFLRFVCITLSLTIRGILARRFFPAFSGAFAFALAIQVALRRRDRRIGCDWNRNTNGVGFVPAFPFSILLLVGIIRIHLRAWIGRNRACAVVAGIFSFAARRRFTCNFRVVPLPFIASGSHR
jgi:hypothetical protein